MPTPSDRPPVIAILNSSPDIVDMLRTAFKPTGIVVVSALTHEIREGHVDIGQFAGQHRPSVILYDIAPPYEANWRLFEHVRRLPALAGCRFILTSVNAARVLSLVGADEDVYEVVDTPHDLDRLITAVKEALRARPVRESRS